MDVSVMMIVIIDEFLFKRKASPSQMVFSFHQVAISIRTKLATGSVQPDAYNPKVSCSSDFIL